MSQPEHIAINGLRRSHLKTSIVSTLAAVILVGSLAPSVALPRARDGSHVARHEGTGAENSSFRRHFYRNQPGLHREHERSAERDDDGFRGRAGLGYGGAALGAGIAGLAGAALLNGMEADDQAEAVSYCSGRFKSYDPSTGTYLAYDGNEYPCP